MKLRELSLSGYGDPDPQWGFTSVCLELIKKPITPIIPELVKDGSFYVLISQLSEKCDL
jgi:hypothetical protein